MVWERKRSTIYSPGLKILRQAVADTNLLDPDLVMTVGDLVPLAPLGCVMPDGMEIPRRRMRGEWSNGMLCSPVEIGLGDAVKIGETNTLAVRVRDRTNYGGIWKSVKLIGEKGAD